MSEVPERIWAWGVTTPVYCSRVDPRDSRSATEYIRADLVEALKAERDRFETALGRACLVGGTTYLLDRALAAEAENQRLRSALESEARALDDYRAPLKIAAMRRSGYDAGGVRR